MCSVAADVSAGQAPSPPPRTCGTAVAVADCAYACGARFEPQYETEQGWFWISVPDGTKWNGTSARHNVMEIVASANVVQPHEP